MPLAPFRESDPHGINQVRRVYTAQGLHSTTSASSDLPREAVRC